MLPLGGSSPLRIPQDCREWRGEGVLSPFLGHPHSLGLFRDILHRAPVMRIRYAAIHARLWLYICRRWYTTGYTLKSLEARAPRSAQNPDPLPLECLDDAVLSWRSISKQRRVTAHNRRTMQIPRLYRNLTNKFCIPVRFFSLYIGCFGWREVLIGFEWNC